MRREDAMTERTKLGTHELWYEADTDVIVFVHVGTIFEAEAAELVDFLMARAHAAPDGRIFVISDTRRASGVTSEARKVMAAKKMEEFEINVAMVGASFAVRSIINLVVRAIAVTGRSKVSLCALATEAEGRVWLNERKQARRRP
jgi:hypothetical protein